MKSVSIKVSPEIKDAVLQLLITERNQTAERLSELDEQIERLQSVPERQSTTDGRMRKGESFDAISTFVGTTNGNGFTIQEAADATQTKYPTARRMLFKLLDAGRVEQTENSRWRVKKIPEVDAGGLRTNTA